MPIIVDASVALSWLFVDEFTPASQELLELAASGGIIVPSHWPLEIATGALMGERRERIEPENTERWIAQIEALDTELDSDTARFCFDRILPIARTQGLTIYDSAYLELGVRRGLPLATFDKKLIAAAGALGVTILGN